MRYSLLTLSVVFLAGCTSDPAVDDRLLLPPLYSQADSLAYQIEEASGGRDVFESVSILRFDFVVLSDSLERFRAKHLWDRRRNTYRVEFPRGEDSTIVAVFSTTELDINDPEGGLFVNGRAADSTAHYDLLKTAYSRFMNDTYWLLLPFKLFDPGVDRTIDRDSSDANSDVLRLRFENVGLTPGDQYWLRTDSTGKLTTWSFQLESGGLGHYEWLDYRYIPVPAGSLYVATRKQHGQRAILTPILPTDSLASDIFTDPTPSL